MENKELNIGDLKGYKVPEHIGIIMDGNGRWAKKRGLRRSDGHLEGAENIYKISRVANKIGVKYLTLYAFSTENWNRPLQEVNFLMDLIAKFFRKYIAELKDSNTRVRVIGDRTGYPKTVLKLAETIEKMTEKNTGIQIIIAFNYGGRREIVDAVKKINKDLNSGVIGEDELNEDIFHNYLYAPDVPDADLIIRSSGEQRLSNFLMWQSAYAEFWTSNILWPEFSKSDLIQAIMDYNNRDRRYGGIEDDQTGEK